MGVCDAHTRGRAVWRAVAVADDVWGWEEAVAQTVAAEVRKAERTARDMEEAGKTHAAQPAGGGRGAAAKAAQAPRGKWHFFLSHSASAKPPQTQLALASLPW